MNILFVLYGDLTTNTSNPISLFVKELNKIGHSCIITYPDPENGINLFDDHLQPNTFTYKYVLENAQNLFPNNKPADILHACTPRESTRIFVAQYMLKIPTALVIYLEDNERWISQHHINFSDEQMFGLTNQEILSNIPLGMSNPFLYKQFIGLADGVILIQDKLSVEVPKWVPKHVIPWGVDLDFFSPRKASDIDRKKFKIDNDVKVIVYHGGLNGFTAPSIKDLCESILLINKLGTSCKLIRTGVTPLYFIDELDPEAKNLIIDLGVVGRDELPRILALADLFVQPGRINPFEDLRLPSKIPEFLAMGKPVLLPNVNIAHMFVDEIDAIILQSGTPEEIAKKCIDIFNNPNLAETLGTNARKFAEKYFEINKQTIKLEAAYKVACKLFSSEISQRVWKEVSMGSMSSAFILRNSLLENSFVNNQQFNSAAINLIQILEERLEATGKRVDNLNIDLIKNNSELLNKDQQLLEKDQQLSSKDQQLLEKDQQLSSKDQQLLEKDQQLSSKDQQLLEKNQQLSSKDQQLFEKEQQILNHINSIREIHRSLSWQLSKPVRIFGSITRKVIKSSSLLTKVINKFQIYFIKILYFIKNFYFYTFSLIKGAGGIKAFFKKLINYIRKHGFMEFFEVLIRVIKGCLRQVNSSQNSENSTLTQQVSNPASFFQDINHDSLRNDYLKWISLYDNLDDLDREKIKNNIVELNSIPLISIVMPTHNSNVEWLSEAINSVIKQLYQNWELCIVDDASFDPKVAECIRSYANKDSRIKFKFRKKNGHISAATNSAIEIASGDWIALFDHDDLLHECALYYVAKAINENPRIRLIYSDEDKLNENNARFDPYFKPDWNRDLFYSHNMICHLGVYYKPTVNRIGGFRVGYEGAQDYDLALRFIEEITDEQIHHIPRVLYHWRAHNFSTATSLSTKDYAENAGVRSLQDHFSRNGKKVEVNTVVGGYRVRYQLPELLPKVTLIIPTRNGVSLVKQCIESIVFKTTYKNYEILLIDNNSDDPEALNYFELIQNKYSVMVVRDERPFNYSAINNAAVNRANGDFIALINNDIEVINEDWLSEMMSIAVQDNVGAVGAKLLYPNDTLQHGGVVTGVGGVAGHSHKYFKHDAYGYFTRAQLISSFSAVTAACLIVKKSIFIEVNGLDELNLSIAFNDVDFCLKVREAGYRNIWTPYAKLYHHESATRGIEDTPEKQLRFSKEVLYMQSKWGKMLLEDPAYNPNLTLDYEDFSLAWPPRVSVETI